MAFARVVIAASLVLSGFGGQASAQTAATATGKKALDLKPLQQQCKAEANPRKARPGPALDQVKRIVNAAETEFRLFDGHIIDHTGRIIKFGSVEVESASVATERADSRKLADVPWRRVARYWELLARYQEATAGKRDLSKVKIAPDSAIPSIAVSPPQELSIDWIVKGFANELDQPSTSQDILLLLLVRSIERLGGEVELADPRFKKEFFGNAKPFLKGGNIEHDGKAFKVDIGKLREALKEAVVRAALSDVPWSAAFISGVMQMAGVPVAAFAQDASHIAYISQSLRDSLGLLKEDADRPLYRACDIYSTRARVGDLVCYTRDPDYVATNKTAIAANGLFDLVAKSFHTDGKLPFRITHCDVVVAVEESAAKIITIGGNVNQAVSRRRMNTNPSNGALSRNQGVGCRASAERAGPQQRDLVPEGVPDSKCNLNMQSWFTLLQHVDARAIAN